MICVHVHQGMVPELKSKGNCAVVRMRMRVYVYVYVYVYVRVCCGAVGDWE